MGTEGALRPEVEGCECTAIFASNPHLSGVSPVRDFRPVYHCGIEGPVDR